MRESRVFRQGQNVRWPRLPRQASLSPSHALPRQRMRARAAIPTPHHFLVDVVVDTRALGGGVARVLGGSTWAGVMEQKGRLPGPLPLPTHRVDRYHTAPPARPTHATPAPSLSPRARTCVGARGCGRAELAGGGKARAWVAVHVCRWGVSEMSSTRQETTTHTAREWGKRGRRPRRPAIHALRRQWLVQGIGGESEQGKQGEQKDRMCLERADKFHWLSNRLLI